MKKLLLSGFLLVSVLVAAAQYKKANFFSRSGRTYSLGTNVHALGGGRGTPLGYFFAQGVDYSEKRLFSWTELEFIPSYRYSYNTTYFDGSTSNETPVTVTGKTRAHLIYNYQLGYHLLNRSESNPLLQPYLFAGLNIVVLGKSKESDQVAFYDVNRIPVESGFTFGLKGGAGVLLSLSEKWGVNITGGYNHIFNWSGDDDYEHFDVYVSHLSVTAGIRFTLTED